MNFIIALIRKRLKSQLILNTGYILLSGLLTYAQGQTTARDYPVIGEVCPDFELTGVQNYPTDRVSLSDLKGRFVILDFWHRHCASCIGSFPTVDSLYRKYRDSIEIFTVGLEDKKGLAELYRQLYHRYGLQAPAAFDSTLFKRFVPGGAAPHYIWIDREGKVKAITGTLEEKQLLAFINNSDFYFEDRSFGGILAKQSYSKFKPFLVDGNGGSGHQIRFRSILLPYERNSMPFKLFPPSFEEGERLYHVFGNYGIEGVGLLSNLYKFAYLGEFAWTNNLDNHPVYATTYNHIVSEFDDDVLPAEFKNSYWYGLIVPEEKFTRERILSMVRSDLSHNFGYKARVEIRKMPYWKVVVDPDSLSKLRTKGGKQTFNVSAYRSYRNFPFEKFIANIFSDISSSYPPILYEGASIGNIDINFGELLLNDFDYISTELSKHGIYLKKAKRRFRVLVLGPPRQD